MNRDDIDRMAFEAGFDGPLRVRHRTQLETLAALVAAAERDKTLRLWMLLDDVDTAGDIAKADDKLYRELCEQYQRKRWEVLSGDEVDAALRARGAKATGGEA
jgi:hypothetical protein